MENEYIDKEFAKELSEKVTKQIIDQIQKPNYEIKIVTYKIAKALKEAGFDEICEYAYLKENDKEPVLTPMEKDWAWERMNNSDLTQYLYDVCEEGEDITAPTYFQALIWLKQEKGIDILYTRNSFDGSYQTYYQVTVVFDELYGSKNVGLSLGQLTESTNPEDSIIAAIDYLVDDGLIK